MYTVVHMFIRSTSAIANAKSEVVYSNVYENINADNYYHSLISSFFAICALNIEYEYASVLAL
jgi:hypothetical protein